MVQQISQLRAEAEMVGSDQYVARATAIARANSDLGATAEQMGVSTEQANVQIINATPAFERYRLRVDAVARAERDMDRVRRAGQSAIEQGRATQEEVNETLAAYERRLETARAQAERSYGGVRAEVRKVADETRRYADEAESAARSTGRLDESITLLKRTAAALGVTFTIAGFASAFNATEARVLANERAVARLNAQLAVTGGAVGKSLGDIQRLAFEIERDTGVAAQLIMDRAAALTTFTSIAGDQFDRTMRVALDMAEVYDQDLKSALEAVGRAMEHPLKGMGMLEKQGFRLETSQKEQIKTLLEQNRQYEAQEIVLRMLEDLVGGTAAAAYTGLGAAQEGARLSGARLLQQWYEQSDAAVTSEAAWRQAGATFEWLSQNTLALADAAKFAGLSLAGLVVARTATAAIAALPAVVTAAYTSIYTFAVANGAYTASAVAATAASRGFQITLAALGGPVGAILTAIGLGAAAWMTYGRALDTSSEAVERNRRVMEELTDKVEAHGFASQEDAKVALRRAEASEALTKSLIREAEAELALAEARSQARDGRGGVLGLSAADISADVNAARVTALRERLNELGGESDANIAAIAGVRAEIDRLGAASVDTAADARTLTDEQLKLRKAAADNVAAITAETASLLRIAAAYDISTEAVIRERIEQQVTQATLKNRMTDEAALRSALLARVAAEQAAAAAQQLVNDRQATSLAAERARAAAIVDPSIRREREAEIDRMEYRNRLEREYALQLERIPELMAEWDTKRAYEAQAQFWNDARRKAEEVSGDIADFLVDGFVNAERGGKSAFENLWEGALAGARRFVARLAAELLQQRIILPIVMSVVGGSGSLFGIASPGGAGGVATNVAAMGGNGGVGVLGGLSSLLNGGLSSSWLTGIGREFATSSLGTALGLSNIAPKGATIISGSGASFAQAFGNLPYAGIGGMLGGLMGLGSGNTLIDMGLSTLGGIGGSMLATTAVGSSIGAALGIGGAALGPIGAVVGGLLGTALGGVFGGKPSNNFAMNEIDLATGKIGNSIFNPSERSQGTIDAAQKMAEVFLEASQAILALTGGTGPLGAFVVAGERDGFQVGIGREGINLFNAPQYGASKSFGSPEKAVEWMVGEFTRQLTGVENENIRKAIAYGGDTETLLGNLTFVQQLNALTDDGSMALVNALKALNDQFDAMAEQAKKLGIATSDLERVREREIAATRAQFEAVITGLQGQANTAAQQYFAQTLDPLTQFRDSVLRQGQLSNMSSRDQFLYSQSLFRGIDETTSASDIVSLGQTYLAQARNFGASGDAFTSAFREVNSVISQLIDTREEEKRGFEALGVTFQTSIGDQTAELKEAIERLMDEVVKLRRAQEKAA